MIYEDLCESLLHEMISRHRGLLTKYPEETEESITEWENVDPTPTKINVMKMVKMANNPHIAIFNNVEDARKIVNALTTPVKELTWVLNQIESKQVTKLTDKILLELSEYLKSFTELSRKKGWSGPKNLTEIKTFTQLIELVDAVAGKQTKLKFSELHKPGSQVQWAGTIGDAFWTVIKIPPIENNFPLAASYFNQYARRAGYCIGREATFKLYASRARALPDQQHAGFYIFFRNTELQGVLTPYQEFKDANNWSFTDQTPHIKDIRQAALAALPEYYKSLEAVIDPKDKNTVEHVRSVIDRYREQCLKAISDDAVFAKIIEHSYSVAVSLAFRPKPGKTQPMVATYQEFVSNQWINPVGFQRYKSPRDIVDQFAHNILCTTASNSLIVTLYKNKVAPMSKHTITINLPGGAATHAGTLTADDYKLFGVLKGQAITQVPAYVTELQSKFDDIVSEIVSAIVERTNATAVPNSKAVPRDTVTRSTLEQVSKWNTEKNTKVPAEYTQITSEHLFPSVFKINI